VESVEPKVSDMSLPPLVSVSEDVPTVDVAALMDKHDVKNVPIVDEEGKLKGLISERGLAKVYVRRLKIEPLRVTPIDIKTLARILKAKIFVKAHEKLSGKVYTVVDALHVALSKLSHDDMAVVGDNEPAQLALIGHGIAALVVVDGAPVGERVIHEAKQHNTSLLATSLDAFGVGKMINLSLPAKMIMTDDVPKLSMDDTISYAKELVYFSKFRSACVVDNKDHLLGVITRTTLMEDVHKSVILLDHNEFSQAVDGIEEAEILEIIDHHRLGTINTLRPVKFLNDPVGSTSTIIARKFVDSKVAPAPKVAGALLSGILSDTLVLKLSTTTDIDVKMANYLAEIANVDVMDYGMNLIKAGMNLEGLSLEEMLNRDVKRYVIFGKNIMISQVMVPSFEYDRKHAEEIQKEVKRIRKNAGLDCFFVLFTNVFENASDFFADGEQACLNKLLTHKQPVTLKNVMSRKKDFLPKVGQILRNMNTR
jgi:manganese-dependent inorganic pyrophosphatase